MEKLQELLGDIDSNDFEKVKSLLTSFKTKKSENSNSSPGVSFNSLIESELDENTPLATIFAESVLPVDYFNIGEEKKRAVKGKQNSSEACESTGDSSLGSEGPTVNSIKKPVDKNNSKIRGSIRRNSETTESAKKSASDTTSGKGQQIKGLTAPPSALTSFGFMRTTLKNVVDKRKLFSVFVPDKRLVPKRLRLWEELENEKSKQSSNDTVHGKDSFISSLDGNNDELNTTPKHEVESLPFDPFLAREDSSLMHPAIPVQQGGEVSSSSPAEVVKLSFSEIIERSNQSCTPNVQDFSSSKGVDYGHLQTPFSLPSSTTIAVKSCGCNFHVSGFDDGKMDNEVLFCGFFSIACEPFVARPPYFGSFNHFLNDNLSEGELLQLARFSPEEELPQFSSLDYDYDSGDDWDVLEGDEDIGSSVDDNEDDGDDEVEGSLCSSDLDFINDDVDESDSDNELQRNMIDARERRKNRLRGKDKLVPSFSGPFVGILPREHPLQKYDRLECFSPLVQSCVEQKTRAENFFEVILKEELSLFGGVGRATVLRPDTLVGEAEMEEAMKQKIQEAALKNRREMSDEEIKAMKMAVGLNNRITSKLLFDTLRGQQLCVGVPQKEQERTLKRFFDRRHGMLIPRDKPWDSTDERLFTSTKKITGDVAPAADSKPLTALLSDAKVSSGSKTEKTSFKRLRSSSDKEKCGNWSEEKLLCDLVSTPTSLCSRSLGISAEDTPVEVTQSIAVKDETKRGKKRSWNLWERAD